MGVQPHVLLLTSLKSGVDERLKIYPALSGSAAWKLKSGLVYLGSDITVPLSSLDYDEEAESLIVSPFVGYRWKLGNRLYLISEIKWHGANIRSDQLTVEYLPIGKHGAVSTLFSLQRSF